MIGAYILDDDGNPVPEPDPIRWAEWFKQGERHLARDEITGIRSVAQRVVDEVDAAATQSKNRIRNINVPGTVLISTVFLALGHSFDRDPPVLWETMIFGGKHDKYQERYTSREDALAGHARAVFMVRESEGK